jgi:predicted component of viral defense system (DUF524 family)
LPANGSFIELTADGLQVRLQKGKRSRISFRYGQADKRTLEVSLFYNRRFKRPSRRLITWDGSYTAFFDPDYSMLVMATGDAQARWLHFDAKYRLESSDLEKLFSFQDSTAFNSYDDDQTTEYDREIARLHKRDDLFKMHTYRDGILGSRGAYILFPGIGTELHLSGAAQNLFVRNPSAFGGEPTRPFPSVGAFDLCPGRGPAQEAVIESFLKSVFDTVLNGDLYQEETGLF